MNQLDRKFLVRPVSFEGIHRIEKGQYPTAALREVLLNALVHRNYMGAHIQIKVFDDRISFWNDGALPDDLTIELLKRKHSSKPRNPIIADACFKGGYIDAWGRGIEKIINACKEEGLPEPLFEENSGGMLVTLFNNKLPAAQGSNVKSRVKSREKVIELIVQNPSITVPDIASSLDMSIAGIEKIIRSLKQQKSLRRVGPDKGGHWEIIL